MTLHQGTITSEAAANRLRREIQVRCGWKKAADGSRRKRIKRNDFTEELPGLPARSLRWLERAMSQTEPLRVAVAKELVVRCHLVARSDLPDQLLRELFANLTPKIILLPGQARLVAKMLADVVEVSSNKREVLKAQFERCLRPFEDVFHSRLGEAVVPHLRAAFGQKWEDFMDGLTRISSDGNKMYRESWSARLAAALRKPLKKRLRERANG